MTELTVPIGIIERLHREAEEMYLTRNGMEPIHGYHRTENDLNGDGVNSVTFRIYTDVERAYMQTLSNHDGREE